MVAIFSCFGDTMEHWILPTQCIHVFHVDPKISSITSLCSVTLNTKTLNFTHTGVYMFCMKLTDVRFFFCLYSIHPLVIITEAKCFLCEVRNWIYVYIMQFSFGLQWVNRLVFLLDYVHVYCKVWTKVLHVYGMRFVLGSVRKIQGIMICLGAMSFVFQS